MAPRPVLLLCLAEALSMAGFAAYPAFLPSLRDAWRLNDGEAGLIGGAFFLGYMLAVPLLAGLTDRIDARRVFISGCLLAAASNAGFALFAEGIASAVALQALAGAGLAGSYMPGLKALTDRVHGPLLPRYIAFYTATFGIGTTLSLLAAGQLGALLPWRTAFAWLALGPLAAVALVGFGIATHTPPPSHGAAWWPRFGPVAANPDCRRYILGYAAHCWELFALRSWMVAFVAFAWASQQGLPWLTPTEAAAAINLLGLPASVLGNEVAAKLGRERWIGAMMLGCGALSWLAGASVGWPWAIVLGLLACHFVLVMGDSATLTAGLVAAAPPAQRGAAMALHSLLGFGAGFIGPLVFGLTLDAAGGHRVANAWWIALGTLGIPGLLWCATFARR